MQAAAAVAGREEALEHRLHSPHLQHVLEGLQRTVLVGLAHRPHGVHVSARVLEAALGPGEHGEARHMKKGMQQWCMDQAEVG